MNIYVSNINFRTEEASLNQLFANYGEVNSTRIITDRETGRSRGFGFVEMLNDEEGQAAIDALNGKEFEEKELNISVARPREEHTNNRGGYQSRGGYNRGGGYNRNNDRGGYNRGGGYNRNNDRYNDRGGYQTRGGYDRNEYRNSRYNNDFEGFDNN